MIVKMLKTMIVCRTEDRSHVLNSLRELGVLHIEQSVAPESQDMLSIKTQIGKFDKAISILADRKGVVIAKGQPPPAASSPEEIIERVLKLKDATDEIKQQLDTLANARERLLPWGHFSMELIEELRSKGIHVYLCVCPKSQLDDLQSHGTVNVVRSDKNSIYAALVADHELNPRLLPLAPISAKLGSLDTVEKEMGALKGKLEQSDAEFNSLSTMLETLNNRRTTLTEELEFTLHLNGMGKESELSFLTGYIPANLRDDMLKAAQTGGWAALMVKPSHDDQVPTLIQRPKLFAMSKPIFDLIGVAPSYTETDISVCFLIFLSIFVGILIGDAGYGALIMGILIAAKMKVKGEDAQLSINLGMCFAFATIVWGLLTGSFFGIEREYLKHHLPFLGGIHFFTSEDSSQNQANIRYVCFMIAALHLSIAHVWKAFCKWEHGHRIIAIGQSGWILFLWGNFCLASFLVASRPFPHFALYLYIVGFVLMLLSVEWNDIGGIFEFPLSILSSFVDLLSYIRLFAVGLAGVYVAENFNNIAHQAAQIPFPVVGVVLFVIVVVFGHGLNFALGALAILVHGVRLNTLEFSGHVGLSWAGFAYKPFKKNAELNNQ